MKEALGRNIKNGDIVLIKKGKYGEDFNIGIIIGKSGVTTDGKTVFNNYSTCYLLENPTDYERNLGDSLMHKYIEHRRKVEKESKSRKDKLGHISLKDMKVGDIGFLPSTNKYRAEDLWIYLGKVDLDENEADKSKLITDMYAYAYYGFVTNSKELTERLNRLREDNIDASGQLSDRLINIKALKRPIPFTKAGVVDTIKLRDEYRYSRQGTYGYLHLKIEQEGRE